MVPGKVLVWYRAVEYLNQSSGAVAKGAVAEDYQRTLLLHTCRDSGKSTQGEIITLRPAAEVERRHVCE